jgi:two-component system nitrogen regulation sensor histidine kinase NtrY
LVECIAADAIAGGELGGDKAMSFRQRLLVVMAMLVTAAVGTVAWFTSVRARAAFEQVDHQRTAAIVSQFHEEFGVRQASVAKALERLSANEEVQHIALEAAHGGDTSLYVREARTLAREQQLDYLDLVAGDGTILSSAEWPAHFAYKLPQAATARSTPALDRVEIAEGGELGLVASRAVTVPDGVLYLYGGKRLDAAFLKELSMPAGARVWMVQVGSGALGQNSIVGEAPPSIELLRPLLAGAVLGKESSAALATSRDPLDRVTVQAIPLRDEQGTVSTVLLVETSRRPLLELERQIKAAALATAGVGLLLSILLALWISGRFSRPVEQLAAASREIAAGNWNARVDLHSRDEFGELGRTFNSMTTQLAAQRDKLVQAERVAAWRELARRLAHELKNPLFPLQITAENLMRARKLTEHEFDEVFEESTATLLEELGHLKTIIGRFSDFSKMPKPQVQMMGVNALLQRVLTLHSAQLAQAAKPVLLETSLDGKAGEIEADEELLYRVVSNLVLNAVDAMPEGGTISMSTRAEDEDVVIEVRDTGVGMTPEESARLFTPYYTTKQHGTGLGLAIAQSVVSDHHGTITVESEPGRGSAFILRLPRKQPQSALQAEAAR